MIAICLTIVLALSGEAQKTPGALPPCAEQRVFTAEEYWFWDGYSGVTDVRDSEGIRKGRLAADVKVCFSVTVADTTDPMARTRGYREAVQEWFKALPREQRDWDSATAKTVRSRLETLTGLDLPSRQAWTDWWVANGRYLRWSSQQNHLVVDAEARQRGTPLIDDRQEISAVNYWFYEGQGFVLEQRIEGAFVLARVFTGERTEEIRVPAAALQDRTTKEQGYRLAVERLIGERLSMPSLKGTELQQVIDRLSKLTGQTFQDRAPWLRWWEQNKNRLVLSPDGERLVNK
jgi:hypothetical protein